MKYVSIDIETTGLDPTTGDILQFAAVLDDLRNPKPISELPHFNAYFLKNNYRGEPYALWLNSAIFKLIADFKSGKINNDGDTRFMLIEDLMTAFSNWLSKNNYPEERGKYKLNIAGKNAAMFDIPWLKQHIPHESWANIVLRHRVIDPASHYLDLEVDEALPDSKLCMERAGIEGPVAHTALEDALMVVRLVREKFLPKPKKRTVPNLR